MVQRYYKTEQYILKMIGPGIFKLIPSPAEELEVEKMVNLFNKIDDMTKRLQKESNTLMLVHDLHNANAQDYSKLQF